ncbi:MAG: ComEC/Rec2-related protein [Acidobacteria bacterium]|nr:ComEC/Rec2-related protein [Acidobacteriota bacterium]
MGSRSREPSFATHPLALLLAALSSGILIAHFFPLPIGLLLSLAAGVSLAPLLLLSEQNRIWPTLLIVLAALLTGATLEAIEQRPAPANRIKNLLASGLIVAGDPVELTGVLEQPPEYTPDSFYLTIHAEKLRLGSVERNASGVVQLLAPLRDDSIRAEYEALQLRYGARVRVITVLERPDNYRNPGVSSFTEFLDRKGQDATGKLKSPLLVERLEDERIFLPLHWLYEWRGMLEREIKKHFSAETAGVLDAALLGNRYNLSHQAAERFREGGTFHVLVISGLHISFIGAVVLLIVRRVTRKKWLQLIVSLVVLWSYTVAVGAESSVVRSALMFSLVAMAPLVSRRASSLNALGGAGLLLLLSSPRNLFDPSFQLTFVSVLAIVVIAAPLLRRLSQIGEWQPTMETPYPPSCRRWLRRSCEALYWSGEKWRREMASANYSYQLFKSPLAVRLERYHLQGILRYGVGALIVSASVQGALLPLLILYFHRLSVASLVLNIFVSVLMALLGFVALAALVLVHLSSVIAAPLIALANTVNWLMVHSVDLFANLGVASLRLPEYSGWPAALYAVYYLPLVWLIRQLNGWRPLGLPLTHRSQRRRTWTTIAAALQLTLLLLLVAHPLSAGRPEGRLKIDFLDVGQGDAALVTLPDGQTLLIDGGGRPGFGGHQGNSSSSAPLLMDDDLDTPFERDTRSIGEAVVSEYLWWRGLDRIDYILATHADADHMDGLNDVMRNFQVGRAFVARTPGSDPEYAKFAATLRARQVPQSVLAANDELKFGDVTITVLGPPAADDNAPSRNNDSIVLRLKYGQRTIMMTGDVEKEGEAAILAANTDIHADVVKVPHHGSKTSSTAAFVAATHPRLAIISVGTTSMFGHPTKEVVERWQASGAEVMTTGKRGTITVSTDGRDLVVRKFIQCGVSEVR